eukprot:g45118.t1
MLIYVTYSYVNCYDLGRAGSSDGAKILSAENYGDINTKRETVPKYLILSWWTNFGSFLRDIFYPARYL